MKIRQINSENYSFQDRTSKVKCEFTDKHALQDPTAKSPKKQSFPDHNLSEKDVQDIISLKIAFPHSFDTIGNMPGVYTICLDPSVPPVQHARCKIPIDCREAIEKFLQDMVDQEIIAPVTEPMECVSSLTYP